MADQAGHRGQPQPAAAPPTYSPHAVHMLRTAQMSTLMLSQMADQKASMLMGASFVVFSLAVGQVLANGPVWPLAVLTLFAFISALAAAIAVMPSIGKPRHASHQINRLFFGHFHDLNEEEWIRSVLADLQADEGVFRLMLHDAWQNGQVLHRRKYRWLGYAYRLFIAGLLATLVAFALELLMG